MSNNKIKKYNFSDSIEKKIRITLVKNEKFFGPGVATLLRYVDKLGSLQKAALEMNMSYSKAWNITKRVEKELGEKVLSTKIGGAGGGISQLTKFGKEFLSSYDAYVNEVEEFAQATYKKYF